MKISGSTAILLAGFTVLYGSALAQAPAVLRDLDALSPTPLSKQDLEALLPEAHVQRVIANGNTHIWKNDSDGTFIISSDNRATTNHVGRAPGKWNITDDGRYCVLIEWRNGTSEDWCRHVIKTTEGYYLVRSVKGPTEKVYKIEFSK